jgi:hypothetical protein
MSTNLKTKRERGQAAAAKRQQALDERQAVEASKAAYANAEPKVYKPLDTTDLATQAGAHHRDFHSLAWALANAESERANIERQAAEALQMALSMIRLYKADYKPTESELEFAIDRATKSILDLTR